ncbi:hypothetical protein [Phenylobacterium sp.]|jgi:hypothetical protein|uniref:hypothetical protein n=1 Tax=Phenylobacterium sp. TaxID=1871053 RepID=UPI002E35810D|nr:hypothetical protein [Phenylobacterium sp.]HEX3365787.1 hypothetical protein [Phenylobacterium sp.]
MTVVVAWREGQGGLLWVVSDSRLSDGDVDRRRVLTDHGAKVMEIPVVVYSSTGFVDVPHYRTTFGLSFAGSSLIAMQAYATALPLWSRLATRDTALPTLDDLADHFALILARYAKGLGAAGLVPRCACLLVGYDPSTERSRAKSLVVSSVDGSVSIAEACVEDEVFEVLGRNPEKVRANIHTFPKSARMPFETDGRKALRYIRDTLRNPDDLEIGGGVQIGICSVRGFEPCFDAPSLTGESPFPNMRFRGLEFEEISRVGPTFVNLRGIG